MEYDIAIIGGGAAGLTVAAGAAQLGARTLLIEKEPMLGGDCLHYGCVPSKTLIESARMYHRLRDTARFGLPEVTVGRVDFTRVRERIRSVVDRIQQHDSVERFCRLGVRVEFGQPRFVDEHAVSINGRTVAARSWVIASGSSPAAPPFPALNGIDYLTNREIFSLEELPPSLAIVGAGPIAIEMAQAFCRLGSQVTVLQRGEQILSREDRDMADAVMHALAAEGVRFVLGARVIGAREVANGKEIRFVAAAGEEQSITVHSLLVALGRSANTNGLGLEEIGVEMGARGITVDARMRTNHSHIYAPGDVNGSFQFTHAAGYEGGIVVSNAVFRLPRKANYSWMPWCTYCDPELASIGLNEKAARARGVDYQVWSEDFSANDRALAEGEERGKIKMVLDHREKPIGVQIFGPSAGELISHWVAALNGSVNLSTLAGAVTPYPTLAEINKRVVGNYFSPKIFSDTVKKGLKLFFQLKGPAGDPCSHMTFEG